MYESNLYLYLYFILFIIIGGFFTFNFFIRVFINMLDNLRHKIRVNRERERLCVCQQV